MELGLVQSCLKSKMMADSVCIPIFGFCRELQDFGTGNIGTGVGSLVFPPISVRPLVPVHCLIACLSILNTARPSGKLRPDEQEMDLTITQAW